MTTAPSDLGQPVTPMPAGEGSDGESMFDRMLRAFMTQRVLLLAALLVIVLAINFWLSANGYMYGSYDFDYLASQLVYAVPMAMLGLAELLVIVSGRGGIDLSIGSIVSLSGMVFGFAYGMWGWPFWLGALLAAGTGALLGLINGLLVSRLGFPALIATLATYYAYKSLALVINKQMPISTKPIQELSAMTRSVELPVFGQYIPDIPLGVFTFLLPTVVIVWLILERGTYGRRLFGIGTNDVAAHFSGVNVAGTRMRAYVLAGLIGGIVAVYLTGQYFSARPNAGTEGAGLALPAITIAVLGGVAIMGGIGRVAGVVLATILIVWLNAGIGLSFQGNTSSQLQILALGVVLILAALLNGLANRRYGGK